MPSNPDSPRLAVFQLDGSWWSLAGRTRKLTARRAPEVRGVLRAAEQAANDGNHVLGFVAYEAAAAFGLACHAPVAGLPLAAFIVSERLEPYDPEGLVPAALQSRDLDWQPAVSSEEYSAAVGRVRDHLARGDSYQVNLTFTLSAPFQGDSFGLFARLALAQRSSCAAYLDFGRFAICSASPEIFFSRDGEAVTMRPMKGTAKRGRTLAEDRRRGAALRRSVKERAENLMIVDMARNDLGQAAQVGSVDAPVLFQVERFPTVLQMTSTVVARTNAPLTELFAAAFPCASVTGAPKVRTAQLIRELEPGPRGVYTGAVGYAGPGRRAEFAVAIRTATVDRKRAVATYGVGSGIVWDSRARREYAECLAKARILEADIRAFALLETIRWDPVDGFVLLERHLRRQAASARYFGIPYQQAQVRRTLEGSVGGSTPLRVRLLVGEDGRCSVEAVPLQPDAPRRVRVAFAAHPVDVQDPFLFHKTTRRDVYERAKATRPGCDQVLLWNKRGSVTETDIANVAVLQDGRWITPPASEGLLLGVMRAELLKRRVIAEGVVTVEDVRRAPRLAVFNSVRGWREAELAAGTAEGPGTECRQCDA